MYKALLFLCISVSILSACSSNTEKKQVITVGSAPTVAVKSENTKVDPEKESRDFAFVLINSRQQFKDIGSIGVSAYKDFIEKKSTKDEFIQKIETMNVQLQSAYKKLEAAKLNDDPNLKSLYADLKSFVSLYYLDYYYHGLLADSVGDDKLSKSFSEKAKPLESQNRDIDKKLNDLKLQYKL
ncbi:hypothetical protein BC351_10575 [Paenibacillus ferrarius]|uniref:Lipoprotein n=1 Tax=Paenibacillus ferrarius TaxID=1469647 RepID=A0A1V4H8S8_9BACL|nr:hypothetical protein [Paenibacillus ferrarius]OPH47625.1 hypothetical protein BC351_10575 [Paenibacillus ferrarius]